MNDYLNRADWDARLSTGIRHLEGSEVDGTALHWPAMTAPIIKQTSVASALRNWQRQHMDDEGWSDIAYQVAVDQAGRKWLLRGLTVRSAANGNDDVNDRFGAILLVLAIGEQPTLAMRQSVRDVVQDFRTLYPDGTRIVPHSLIRPKPTDCPGDIVRAGIARGDFAPLHNPGGNMSVTPTSPLGDDSVKPGETMNLTKLAARVNYIYKALLDGGKTDTQLDRIEAEVKDD